MPQQEHNSLVLGLVLGIDTCGPAGSVALGRLAAGNVEILGEAALEGRTYSALLTGAIAQLVTQSGAQMRDLRGIVVVNGPGSFTGVRVGVSTAKGLADGLEIPVVAVSRLEVLARKAGVQAAALDAHRDEVYLRVAQQGQASEECLAGAEELTAVEPVPRSVAICDDGAARLLSAVWPDVELRCVVAPLASDALRFGVLRLSAGEAVDLILLDGHYLRRSDAEIFGEKAQAGA
ncbi:MAG: tRNA (adenosine(37)-N6)-threonylcarbamoyltransferase complex dimerization subunit type 1 TsaB [Terracidiphilus sp.]|nr:tRNA (adenosine(37)-N6)-threonylcarbamoyltransferase complex dimerization subunit type 1 TsaB [Terracidiphilus sp.]